MPTLRTLRFLFEPDGVEALEPIRKPLKADLRDVEKIKYPNCKHVILNEVKNLSVGDGDSSLRKLRSE